MKGVIISFWAILLTFAFTCSDASAQATAQISGAVQDSSGAVLPGAEITAMQTDTGINRMTITNETGAYVLSNLPLGPYRLEAALPGFRTFVQTGIVLQVNSNPTINIVLQVGQVTEQVEVQANASLVDTRSVSVGQVMESARIVELPLNGRNAQELLLLGGGAVQAAPAGALSFPDRLLISSAGALATSTEYTLDGVRHVDPFDGYGMLLPFPDALSEFKTEMTGLSTQQGRGSQVSAVTKSGTNAFHGDLFEFVRNDLFNARSYFATQGSTLKRNQYGGTFGGPIVRNKLFFFGGYQATPLRQDPADTRQFVPTAAMLAGDFTAFTAPACNAGRQITLRAPFVNNRIDPGLFSPAAVKLAARIPSSTDPCGQITFGKKTVNDEKQLVSKVDYQLSAKHSLFGRFLYSSYNSPSPSTFTPNNVLNVGLNSDSKSYAFTAGSTYLINAGTVNALRLSVVRNLALGIVPKYFDASDLGIKIYTGYAPKVMAVGVTSGFTLSFGPRQFATMLYQLADDVSMTRGKHQFGFGARVAQAREAGTTAINTAGTFNFDGSVTGLGLADFLTGKLANFSQGFSADNFSRMKFLSLYGQDTWQVTPRLTMNYGLRWSPVLPIVDGHRPVPNSSNFDINRYKQGIRSTVFVNAPPGLLYPGDPGFVQSNNGSNAAKPQADLWNPYWKEFGPRIGLAWDVQGNGRTSIRASYGLSYEEYPLNYRLGSSSAQSPWGSFTQLLAPVGGFDDPWQGVPGGNPFPFQLNKNMAFVPGGDYLPSNPNLTPTYTESWNLSLQRELVAGTLLSASYLGTQVVHLQASTPLNEAIFVPGVGDANGNCFLNGQPTYYKVTSGAACSTVTNTQARRALSFLNPAFANEIGRLAIVTNGGTQHYNGMLLSLQRRPSHGINMSANYTLSHCVGDFSARSNSGYGPSVDHTYQDANNRRLDRGACEADQRHNFNFTGVAETPKFSNHIMTMVGTGWRLSAIYRRFTSGSLNAANVPSGLRTVTLGAASGANATSSTVDRCLCNISSQRPNQILPDVYLDRSGRPGTQYLNPAAFALPALGTLGNVGRATLQFPTSWQFDMALSRVFHVRETQSLEFRAEAYNVTNSFRPAVGVGAGGASQTISTNLSDANFGKIRFSQDPRIFQFALKYLF